MVLLTILIIIMLLLIGFIIAVTTIGGAIFTIVFADVIVCIVLIALFIRWLCRRKRR